jgi:hypothetical protein
VEQIVKNIGALGATIAFAWSVFQFFSVRRREDRAREFEVFHRLIKELVEPPPSGPLYIDRQAAVLFELRFYPRYFEFTNRTLEGLRAKWEVSALEFPRLLEELRITQEYVARRQGSVLRRLANSA